MTKKTKQVTDQICELIANSSKGLRDIGSSVGVTRQTILKWLDEDPKFSAQYARAKELQADYMAEEILTISDDGTRDDIITDNGAIPNHEWIARAKLRVDSRKFLMSKLAPKRYGDKLDITSEGKAIPSPVINVHPKE